MGYKEFTIEGRNAVIEAFRSGKTMDKVFLLDKCQDGPLQTIIREARKQKTMIKFVSKERLDQMSETERHQGVIAYTSAYEYAEVDDMLEDARKKGEDPFLILLDKIEDPHNLGAVIRTCHLSGAHGVIIPKNRAVGLTGAVARISAGALKSSKSDKLRENNGGTEKTGYEVCMWRYGWRSHVFFEFKRSYRACHWQRRKRGKPVSKRKM